MKRWIFTFSIAAIFFFTTVAYISWQIHFPLIENTSSDLNPKFYDYSGITHVHSKLSTGSGSIEDISRAANKARCHFIIITDLNPPLKKGEVEGYRDDVLVIWAAEYSYLGGHLLAYGLPARDLANGTGLGAGMGQTQVIFNELLQQKPRPPQEGFLIAAHPYLPQHSWENLQNPGLKGMEVINLDSIWRSEIAINKLSVLWSFLILPFNPDLSYLRLFNEPLKEVAAWDEVLQKHAFVGFGGTDATANAIPFPKKSWDFPSYAQSFRLMKNHILLKSELTGSYIEDRQKVMDALYHGSFYFSLDLIGNPAGFYFIAQRSVGHNRQEYLPGQTLQLGNLDLIVDLGHDIGIPHEIILYRNGQKVATSNGRRLKFEVKTPGAYRSTVRVIPTLPIPDGKTWFPWIYSNAIRIE